MYETNGLNKGLNIKRHMDSKPQANNLGSLMVFNRSAHVAYVYQKTEKLVTAVYMVTNFIKDTDPIKVRIRENALELLSINFEWGSAPIADRRELVKEYQGLALEIVSLSQIASRAGLISQMNQEIIAREFNALILLVEKEQGNDLDGSVAIDPSLFDVPAPQSSAKPSVPQAPIASQTPVLDAPAASIQPAKAPATRQNEYLPVKDTSAPKAAPSQAPAKDSKEGRQSVILKLLSKRSGLSIKDFAASITGVSEKTIQRELLSMVAQGVLKKEGERRWSTYSLA